MTVIECDALIIGAGLQGCSIALSLARRARQVVLLDKGPAGAQASGVNAGGVRRLNRLVQEIPLSLAAHQLWQRIEEIVDSDCGFRPSGQLRLAEDGAGVKALQARCEQIRALGYQHEVWIERDDLLRRLPALAPHFQGALFSEGDGSAEPFTTAQAFKRKAESLGVRVFEYCPAEHFERQAHGWLVKSDQHQFRAPILINCAGAWAGDVAMALGDSLPVQPVALSMMVSARRAHFLDPVVGIHGRKLSFKQMENGTIVIGGAHHAELDFHGERTTLDFGKMAQSAQAALAAFPQLGDLPIVRGWAGIEGVTPDNLPYIGRSPQHEDVLHVCAFSAHGFQLAPAVGPVVADLITEGQSEIDLDAFRCDRFAATG